jgi:hypothetical protein
LPTLLHHGSEPYFTLEMFTKINTTSSPTHPNHLTWSSPTFFLLP